MKKILIIYCFICFTGFATGQQASEYLLKAISLNLSQKPDLAINLLTDAIKVTNDSRLFAERAELNILKGNYSDAIGDYNEADKIKPGSAEFGLARIYALKGDAATSLYHLELNLNSIYKKSEKEIMLDKAFASIENSTEWRQFWKKEWYTNSEQTLSEIEFYTSAGKLGESTAALSELKKISKNSEEIIYAEAIIALAGGKYPEAVKGITGLVTLHPENENYLRILAKAQTMASNPAGASVTYSQLLNSGIADAELLLQRAECYRKTGEAGKAIVDIRKYLDLYPENKTALSLAGKAESLSGDNIKALEYFSDNLKLHPNDPECYVDRANAYFNSKSWSWAIADYGMSLDLKPADPDVWLSKGIALVNLGRVEDACHDFQKSLSLGNKRASEYFSTNCIK